MAIELHVRQGVLSKALTAFVISPQGHVPASEPSAASVAEVKRSWPTWSSSPVADRSSARPACSAQPDAPSHERQSTFVPSGEKLTRLTGRASTPRGPSRWRPRRGS